VKRPLILATLGLLAAGAIAVGVIRARGSKATSPIASGSLRGANVLLVTIDTLRADRVGAYGSRAALTPAIDALAAAGLRFERAYAHVPLTLPSHATLMTASYPTRNGVRDNGTFRLGDASPTLAAALKTAGYRTGAFVGAFVLDARFGLNRGFDVYDDRMAAAGDLDLVQRTAQQVLAPARDWILNGASASPPSPVSTPWFAWIHLYDPHEPYAAPEPFRSRYAAEPYDGEIAYADAALGDLVARLRAAGALAHTVVVIASDHGESLGEHGERTHGLFAYDATLRVPLVMWADGRIRPGVFQDTMRLVDVAPTLLDLLGAAPLAAVDGRSVRPFIAGEQPFDDGGSYFEALNAHLTRNWAPLTGILRERMKLIDLPVPELYDLAADPGERQNIYASARDRARDLERRLDTVTRTAAPAAPAPLNADAEARLRSLGYVVGSAGKPPRRYSATDDPKQLVHLQQALDDASAHWARGHAQRAIDELQAVISERPDFTVAYDRLAAMLRAGGRVADAVVLLDRAAQAGHADRPLLRSLGSMLRDAGDLRRSAAVLDALVRGDATDLQSADSLAQTYARMGRGGEAEAQFKRVLAASPNDAAAWNNLGSVYLAGNRLADARAALTRAIEIDPALAGAHNGLGVVYARSGDFPRASAEWTRALELRPDLADARSNLDRIRRK
jgi:arylsulfatase A-like enzyme/Flp pilus assembly protein TadD